jgi:hypothetical protein
LAETTPPIASTIKDRTTLYLLAAVLVLGLLYYFFVNRKADGTVDRDEVAFAVEDTASITRIKLSEYIEGKRGTEVVLERDAPMWRVNGKYNVVPGRMSALLTTLKRIQFREVIHPNARENAFKFLRNNHIRVAVQHTGGSTVYRIGPPTGDHLGTIVWLEGAENPYVAEMPGFEGYLKPMYSVNQDDYRENLILVANSRNITAIEVQSTTRDSSYKLSLANSRWALEGSNQLDSSRVYRYLSLFQGRFYAFSFADTIYPGMRAKLQKLTPDIRLRVTQRSAKGPETTEIVLYKRQDNEDVYFAWVVGQPELREVQHFVIDRLLATRDILEGKPVQ